MAVYVKPNGLLGSVYMAAIRPFRHLIVYPPMLREMGRESRKLKTRWRSEANSNWRYRFVNNPTTASRYALRHRDERQNAIALQRISSLIEQVRYQLRKGRYSKEYRPFSCTNRR
jgi:hypothetical protein